MCCSASQAIFLLFFTTKILTSHQWSYDDYGCRTPDRGVGACKPLINCEPLLYILKSAGNPVPNQIRKEIQKYWCGVDQQHKPKVCCPNKRPNILSTIQEEKPENIDVSNHKNYALLSPNCGYLDSTNKIVNGKQADLFEFPWMALLSYNTSRGPKFKCGGSIINDRYILTAAHCLAELKNPLIGIRVGEYHILTQEDCIEEYNVTICSPKFQDLKVEKTIIHFKFSRSTMRHDIGLVRVSKMDFSRDNIKPVCLPVGEARRYEFGSRKAIVAGWGITESGTRSNVLLKVNLAVMPIEKCIEMYKNQLNLSEAQMCAGGQEDGQDSCEGDSGGPLHAVLAVDGEPKYVQQGIVSAGPKQCGDGVHPGVYTRISFYMKWILDNMQE